METVIDHYICCDFDQQGEFYEFQWNKNQWSLSQKYGYYLTHIIDSEESQREWNRLKIKLNHHVACRIHILITDNLKLLKDIDTKSSYEQRLYLSQHFSIKTKSLDTLLYGENIKGRYLKCCIEFFNPESLPITIQEIHFNYPKVSFDEYLPVIYQDQLFLQKYLAIYQSLYMDIENQIEEFKASLDFDYANEQTLRKIGTWLGIAVDDFDEKILRRYMKVYHDFNKKMGTKVYFEELIEVLCGIKGHVVEKGIGKEGEKLNSHTFLLLIPEDKDIDKEFVEKIVMKNVPFAMHCQIIWLNDRGCFDEYCYIDYNSRLMDIQLDDFQGYSCFDEARMV